MFHTQERTTSDKESGAKMNGFAIAGILFCLAGLLSVIAGNTAIGMMNVSIGMLFTVISTTGGRR
jgi:hypothetical protein